MSGHSHWKQIRHKKTSADEKRGQLFSKLLNSISIAARGEPNPEFNPHLRAAIDKAKQNNVPQENIERAVKRAADASQNLEELVIGAYGPGGAAIKIEAVSDNKNRTIAEIKSILNEAGGKWAESGSTDWAFEKTAEGWRPKFEQEINEEDKRKLWNLIQALEEHNDVQKVYTNAKVISN